MKMKNKSLVFFRNDDIRDTLDDALIKITGVFMKHKIPITHAVEPANITREVADWLIGVKKKNHDLIEIMQHGYDHKVKNKYEKGEFGGQRTYEEQYNDILSGKQLMDQYFGKLWFPAFNFPYAPYNSEAVKAVNDCKFLVLNSHFNRKINRRIFYYLGQVLNKGYWLNHHVSWNLDIYPNTDLFEIDMNISFIDRYYDEDTGCKMFTLETLKTETMKYARYKTIGILLHHRYHNNQDKIKLIEDFLVWIKNQNFIFSTMQNIYKTYSPNAK